MHKVDILTDLLNYSLLTRNLWSGWKTSFNDSNLSVCKLPTSIVSSGLQQAWPQWCTGLFALPSVTPYCQMPSSCHTRRWCNRSGYSRCCSCRTFWGSGGTCHIFLVSWGGKGFVMPSSRLSWYIWTMLVRWWCEHQGTWNCQTFSPTAPLMLMGACSESLLL